MARFTMDYDRAYTGTTRGYGRDYADHPERYRRARGYGNDFRSHGMTWEMGGMDRVGAGGGRFTQMPRGPVGGRGYGGRDYRTMNRGPRDYDLDYRLWGRGGRFGTPYADMEEGSRLGDWSPGGFGASRGFDSMASGRPQYFRGYGAQSSSTATGYRPDWW